jgi:opacity protein-like surface antigen
MSFVPRLPTVRTRAILGSAALLLGLAGSSGAWAQCTDDFNFFGTVGGVPTPVQNLLPLGTGSSLSALTSTINTVNTAFLTSTSAFVSAPGNPQPDQQGGGVWARVIAGTVETNTSSIGTLGGTVVATGTQNCNTTTRQDYWGYQFGHDISILNGGGTGANWHVGVTAGYLEAKTKDITPGGAYFQPAFGGVFVTAPGSLSEGTQVPFVGLYTAFTKGSLALDGQVRWDFYQNSVTDPANGLSGQLLDARGFSVTGNASYNIPLRNNWFVEPSVGAVYSHVSIDPFNVPGLVNAGGPFARGTVTIEDIDSFLGRVSVSTGTSFTHSGVIWQPFFTASVYHEFLGDVTARSLESDTGNPAIDGLLLTTRSSGGIGTYGQLALGTAAVLGNSGWLGYGRVDYRVGDNVEGWSVNTGLRYQFTPVPVRASIKDAPVAPQYSYNWTGPYIGGYVGSTWGDQHWFTADTGGPGVDTRDNPDFAGWLAGGQVGYNVQRGKIVLGLEGDYGFSNARGGKSCDDLGGLLGFAFDFTCEAKVHTLASLTGRIGHTWGRALFYAKGGVAFGEVTVQTSENTGAPQPPSGTPVNGETKWLTGWTIGGGMEFALTDRWSAKAEYMYYDLGRERFNIDNGLVADAEVDGSTVRIGVNLHLHPVQREVPLK